MQIIISWLEPENSYHQHKMQKIQINLTVLELFWRYVDGDNARGAHLFGPHNRGQPHRA